MANQKIKHTPSLREPKPKKKLGLSVPHPLRMPHEELLPSSATKTDDSLPSLPSLPRQTSETTIAPVRDFAKVANSITREAVPAGLFKGKGKQLYDYLYLQTRGARVPSRTVRISRTKLMAAAGIGSRVTFEANLVRLSEVGLVKVRQISGEHEGNEYTVYLPEEVDLSQTSQPSLTSLTRPAQKLDRLVRLETSLTSHSLSVDESIVSEGSKTYFKTWDDDDTHTLFANFINELLQATQEVIGSEIVMNEQERVLWGECGRVLADELRTAARRTSSVSSVPAFFATHLRRQLAEKSRESQNAAKRVTSLETKMQATPSGQGGAISKMEATSKFSLEECRRYAEHLQRTGQGITNPGGYATTIFRTGEADDLIAKFLSPGHLEPREVKRCPDCRGIGFIYPEGVERGLVKPCHHPRLETAQRLVEEAVKLRQLNRSNPIYSEVELVKDLLLWCQKGGETWDKAEIAYLVEAESNSRPR